jgi:hypothetical protein
MKGEVEEHLAGEGVVSRVQRRKSAHQLEDVSVAGEPVAQDTGSPSGSSPWRARTSSTW